MSTKTTTVCLGCREKKPIHIRGLCISCYHQMRRTLKQVPEARREAAEQKLVAAGKRLPKHAGNPFAEELAEFLHEAPPPAGPPLAPHERAILDQATEPGASGGVKPPPETSRRRKKLPCP